MFAAKKCMPFLYGAIAHYNENTANTIMKIFIYYNI